MSGVFATLKRWDWPARPVAVTAIPTPGGLADEVAARVAAAGHLTLHHSFESTVGTAAGANSTFRLAEVWAGLRLTDDVPAHGPVLVVVDRSDSRWTTTVAAHLLAQRVGPVLPLALARA